MEGLAHADHRKNNLFCSSWKAVGSCARRLMEEGHEVLVAQYCEGIDVTVPVLGGDNPVILGYVQPKSDKPGSIITEDLKLHDLSLIHISPPQIGVFCSGISNFSILDNNEDLVRWKAGGTGGSKNLGPGSFEEAGWPLSCPPFSFFPRAIRPPPAAPAEQ